MPRPEPIVPDQSTLSYSFTELMKQALIQAKFAAEQGEVPIGAVLVNEQGELLAAAHNTPIAQNDPTAHAEIRCLRQAAQAMGNYRLPNTIMAVTLEPCIMCVGALIHARVAGVIVGTPDFRAGALFTKLGGACLPWANHKMWVKSGVMQEQCASLLHDFFRNRR